MRKLSIIAIFILLAGMVSALGTFVEQSDKEGPEAVYRFGIIAEQELEVETEPEQRKGISYNYTRVNSFDPGDADAYYMYQGEYMPVKYYEFQVISDEPERSVYEIPVTLRVHSPGSGEDRSASKVVQEREYFLAYGTDFEREYGFDGELVPDTERTVESNETASEGDNQEVLSTNEDNSTSTGGEGVETEQSVGTTTYVLAFMVLITLLYTIREALK